MRRAREALQRIDAVQHAAVTRDGLAELWLHPGRAVTTDEIVAALGRARVCVYRVELLERPVLAALRDARAALDAIGGDQLAELHDRAAALTQSAEFRAVLDVLAVLRDLRDEQATPGAAGAPRRAGDARLVAMLDVVDAHLALLQRRGVEPGLARSSRDPLAAARATLDAYPLHWWRQRAAARASGEAFADAVRLLEPAVFAHYREQLQAIADAAGAVARATAERPDRARVHRQHAATHRLAVAVGELVERAEIALRPAAR